MPVLFVLPFYCNASGLPLVTPCFNVTTLWMMGYSSLRQSVQRCRLMESVQKGLKMSATKPSCPWRFDSGTALSPHRLNRNAPQSQCVCVEIGIGPLYTSVYSCVSLPIFFCCQRGENVQNIGVFMRLSLPVNDTFLQTCTTESHHVIGKANLLTILQRLL